MSNEVSADREMELDKLRVTDISSNLLMDQRWTADSDP